MGGWPPGYQDIRLGRTAALGRSWGPTLGPRNQPLPPRRLTRLDGSAPPRTNGTLLLPSRGLSLFDNLLPERRSRLGNRQRACSPLSATRPEEPRAHHPREKASVRKQP